MTLSTSLNHSRFRHNAVGQLGGLIIVEYLGFLLNGEICKGRKQTGRGPFRSISFSYAETAHPGCGWKSAQQGLWGVSRKGARAMLAKSDSRWKNQALLSAGGGLAWGVLMSARVWVKGRRQETCRGLRF